MAKKDKPPKDTFLRDLGLFGTLGLNLALTTAAGFYIGLKLDRRYHTAPRWILVGFLCGLGIGLYTLFTTVGRVAGPKSNGRRE